MRTLQVLIPAAVLTLALSACGGGGTPTPTVPVDEPTPAPTETTEPAPDPSTVAARIHVSVNHVEIFALDDSPLLDFTMYDPAAAVVADLTEVFGADPEISTWEGGLESPPATLYDWDGFTVIDGEGLDIMRADFVIDVSTPAVGDIQVYTVFDLQAGDPMADAIAVQDFGGAYDVAFAGLALLPIDPVTVGESPTWDIGIFIAAYSDGGTGGTIEHFTAPTPNWGV